MKRAWHWPTEEFWPLGVLFVVLAGIAGAEHGGWAGGVGGMGVMVAFLAGVNILGNWWLP